MSYSQNRKKLQKILLRYQQGTATEEERAFVEKYYQQFEEGPNLSESYSMQERAAMENKNWEKLMDRIGQPASMITTDRVRSSRGWQGWAAACVAALLLTGAYLWFIKPTSPHRPLALTATIRPDSAVTYIRNIVLPDGSHAVLQANSRLQFPEKFAGNAREMTLTGEAYFDIVHDEEHPFVIHTGKLKTTVLGTAFNIKAWPEQEKVEVAVTSGKVRVEDGKKISVELTSNQQITYQATAATTFNKVDAAAIVADWTQKDMIFRDVPFEKVAAVISKRYNIQLLFKNERLKQCQLVASFSGTETLETVLRTLSTILDVQYTRFNDQVTFDGQGCD